MQPPTSGEKGVASILLVDDHPPNLLALRAVLSPLRAHLVEAGSGEEALELTLQHEFAVIFMDVRMTGLSGIRTAALIGERKNRRRPPIILITGLDSDEREIVQAYAHGVVDYLRKPFEPTVLRAKASMFVELFLAQTEIERQSALLREKDRELLESAHREQLEDSEARFLTLANSIPQLTWMADAEGHVFWFNRRWYDYTGMATGETDGWSWKGVHDPAHLDEVVARWSEALARGEDFEMEFPLRRADGAYRWHLTRALPVRDATGAIRRWFGTNTDVDDQRRARELERFLAQASKELSTSLQVTETLSRLTRLFVPTLASFCSVDLLDPSGAIQRVAAHAKPECESLTKVRGRRTPSGRRRGVPQVLESGERLWIADVTDAMLAEFAESDEHLTLLRAVAPKSYLVIPLLVRERVVGAISLVVGPSARSLGESELRVVDELASRAALAVDNARLFEEVNVLNASLEQRVEERTAELQEANRELESFTYSVSHDLRAPLRHITGFAQLLERRLAPQVDEPSRGYLRTISEAAQQGGKLVDDLLAFSRLGRAAMKVGPVDIGALIGDVQRELALDLEGRTVTWRVGVLPPVRADASLLRLALRNLLSNALKYSRPAPEALIEVFAEQHPSETEIAVRDNGVGFDMQYVDKLFGVFQRLHTADEFEGTGIGLANVRRIIARHGGRAWAEGEVGRGATFHITLPRPVEDLQP